MLARRELSVLLEEWLYRIPDFELRSGSKPVFRAARLNGVSEMQLQWLPMQPPRAPDVAG
jgi:hypothetical protein